jgi:putative DNA primase/helicase
MAKFDPHRYAVARVESDAVASDRQLLYEWTGTHWSVMGDEEGWTSAYHWLVEHDRENTSPDNARKAHQAAILWARALPRPTTDIVIPCSNGYVRVTPAGAALELADKSLGLQHVLRCAFLPEHVTGQRFDQFLRKVLPDEAVRARVQEYVGYTLTGDARYQRAQLWLGPGANGKGALANIVQALHGNTAAVNLDALEGFRLSVLVGANLIYADEVPRQKINEQLLKSLIAGERVQIDRKYKEPLSIHVRGKWLVCGNQLPAVTDHSAGFWRRWDIVPFNVIIPEHERNPDLVEQIVTHELSAVLNWALEGLGRLMRRGMFDPVQPRAMQAMLLEAKAETNSVVGWTEDCAVTVVAGSIASKDDIYQHYRDWCGRNGLTPVASPRFWPRVKDALPYEEARPRIAGRQVRACNLHVPGLADISVGASPASTPRPAR